MSHETPGDRARTCRHDGVIRHELEGIRCVACGQSVTHAAMDAGRAPPTENEAFRRALDALTPAVPPGTSKADHRYG
jgi:hypothetical protein